MCRASLVCSVIVLLNSCTIYQIAVVPGVYAASPGVTAASIPSQLGSSRCCFDRSHASPTVTWQCNVSILYLVTLSKKNVAKTPAGRRQTVFATLADRRSAFDVSAELLRMANDWHWCRALASSNKERCAAEFANSSEHLSADQARRAVQSSQRGRRSETFK
jgi:hypothetical protein